MLWDKVTRVKGHTVCHVNIPYMLPYRQGVHVLSVYGQINDSETNVVARYGKYVLWDGPCGITKGKLPL